MLILIFWALCLFNRYINPNILKKQKIQSRVYTKWINHILMPKQIIINEVNDLIDDKNINSFVEVLWDDSIDDSLYYNDQKYENYNFLNFIQYLQSKKINIPKLDIKSIINKKKPNDMLEIVWNIISYYEVDNIYFNGNKGKDGLLKLINKFTDKSYQNFTDSWKNGTTICQILNQFYPNEINISENENNVQYVIDCLQKVGAPIYVDTDFNDYLDENSIIIQYASLFRYLSYPYKQYSNTTIHLQNSNPNYYNSNYLYIQTEYPNYTDGIIHTDDYPNYITFNNQLNQIINEHYKVNMYSRYPKQIAFINNKNGTLKVEYNYEAFEDVLSRSGSKPIIFVSFLGRYQQGKSTLNSGITGNLGYVIGNGNKETTKGVYIDGPYDINYLYERFNISIRDDIYFKGNDLLSPLVYFFDIEGYDGQMHGLDIKQNNELFIKMCTPFLCLSSIFILLSEPNANVYEINSFFERVKVSKLTTYSNNKDSNGALQLHIVFNRYNDICNNNMRKRRTINIKESIKNFQTNMQNEWIGARKLTQYGIKYQFYPILEGLPPFYETGLFFDVFGYFVQKIVRSIEKASEGKFLRSAKQSINLFNYIVGHSNDENFEEMIKLLIRSEHENSFETFSAKSYNETIKKLFPIIDKEFDQYCKIYNFDINIINIKNRYIKIGENAIKKDLKVVQDHSNVAYYIEKLSLTISNKIIEKQIELINFKNKLINEFNEKMDQKADQLSKEYVNKIVQKFDEENNFNFNQTKIDNYVNLQIDQLKDDLFIFKVNEDLFLLSNSKIETLHSEKKNFINNYIIKHMNNEKRIVDQLDEENELMHNIIILMTKKMNDEYCYMEEQIMNSLRGNLKNVQFYKEHYKNIPDVIQSSQKLIMGYIISRKNDIIDDTIYDIIQVNESNSKIIERLKQKNMLIIDNDRIDYIIDSRKDDLTVKINQYFDYALHELVKIIINTRSSRISLRKIKIERQISKEYPNGMKEVSDWEYVRTEKVPFGKILGEAIFHPIDTIVLVFKSF